MVIAELGEVAGDWKSARYLGNTTYVRYISACKKLGRLDGMPLFHQKVRYLVDTSYADCNY
jgi:hypothetical protein